LPAAAVFPPPNAKPDPELAVLLAPNPVLVFPPPPNGLLAAVVLPPKGLFCVVVLVAPNPPPVFEAPKRLPPAGAAVLLPNPPAAGLLWPKRPPPMYELVAVFVELGFQKACGEYDERSLRRTTFARSSVIPGSKFYAS
jgi:hypothetical protein